MSTKKTNNKGFTLVELIVVLVILAILASVVVVSVLKYMDKARFTSNNDNAETVYQTTSTALARMSTGGTIDELCREIMSAGTYSPVVEKDYDVNGNEIPDKFAASVIDFKAFAEAADKDDITFEEKEELKELANNSVHIRYALTWEKPVYESGSNSAKEGTGASSDQGKLIHQIIGSSFYDSAVFDATFTIEIDIEKSVDGNGDVHYSAGCYSVFYDEKRAAWDDKCYGDSGQTVVPERLESYRAKTSLVGYYNGGGKVVDGVYLPRVADRQLMVYPSLANGETLDLTWRATASDEFGVTGANSPADPNVHYIVSLRDADKKSSREGEDTKGQDVADLVISQSALLTGIPSKKTVTINGNQRTVYGDYTDLSNIYKSLDFYNADKTAEESWNEARLAPATVDISIANGISGGSGTINTEATVAYSKEEALYSATGTGDGEKASIYKASIETIARVYVNKGTGKGAEADTLNYNNLKEDDIRESLYSFPLIITYVYVDYEDEGKAPEKYYTYTLVLDAMMSREAELIQTGSGKDARGGLHYNISRLFPESIVGAGGSYPDTTPAQAMTPRNLYAEVTAEPDCYTDSSMDNFNDTTGITASETVRAVRAYDDPIYQTGSEYDSAAGMTVKTFEKGEGGYAPGDGKLSFTDVDSSGAFAVVNSFYGDDICEVSDGTLSGSTGNSDGFGGEVISSFRHLYNIRQMSESDRQLSFILANDLNWYEEIKDAVYSSDVKVYGLSSSKSYLIPSSPAESGGRRIVSFPAIPALGNSDLNRQILAAASYVPDGKTEPELYSINNLQMRSASFGPGTADDGYGLICVNNGIISDLAVDNLELILDATEDGSAPDNISSEMVRYARSESDTFPAFNVDTAAGYVGGVAGINNGSFGANGDSKLLFNDITVIGGANAGGAVGISNAEIISRVDFSGSLVVDGDNSVGGFIGVLTESIGSNEKSDKTGIHIGCDTLFVNSDRQRIFYDAAGITAPNVGGIAGKAVADDGSTVAIRYSTIDADDTVSNNKIFVIESTQNAGGIVAFAEGQGTVEIKGCLISDYDDAKEKEYYTKAEVNRIRGSVYAGGAVAWVRSTNINIYDTGIYGNNIWINAYDAALRSDRKIDGVANAGGGAAGGLVGDISDPRQNSTRVFKVDIDNCFASTYVDSIGGDCAGGLCGRMDVIEGTIKNSYTGGHTYDHKYRARYYHDSSDPGRFYAGGYNCESTYVAGGIFGYAKPASGKLYISNCFSTCSVATHMASYDVAGTQSVGGFFGELNNGNIEFTNNYATGAVFYDVTDRSQYGAFAGIVKGGKITGCGAIITSAVGRIDNAVGNSSSTGIDLIYGVEGTRTFKAKTVNKTEVFDKKIETSENNTYPFKMFSEGETFHGDWSEDSGSPSNSLIVNTNELLLYVLIGRNNNFEFTVRGTESGAAQNEIFNVDIENGDVVKIERRKGNASADPTEVDKDIMVRTPDDDIVALMKEQLSDEDKERDLVPYVFAIDDPATKGGHFANICPDLKPGENILINATESGDDVIEQFVPAKVLDITTGDSGQELSVTDNRITNSLFGSLEFSDSEDDARIAYINNSRHLLNLGQDTAFKSQHLTNNTVKSAWNTAKSAIVAKNIYWKDKDANDKDAEEAYITDISRLNNISESEVRLYTPDGDELPVNSYRSANNNNLKYFYSEDSSSGKTIHNIYVEGTNKSGGGDGQGIFGYYTNSSNTFDIENINIHNIKVIAKRYSTDNSKGGYGGSLIGRFENGILKVRNVNIYGKVDIECENGAGGIVGYMKSNSTADIKDVEINIDTSESIISGDNIGCAGGLIGYHEKNNNGYEISIEDSAVNVADPGSLLITTTGKAGGLVGEANLKLTIKNSRVSGNKLDIKAIYPTDRSKCYAGGLVGKISEQNPSVITDSSVKAGITTSRYGGGLVGLAENTGANSRIENCNILEGTTVKSETVNQESYIGGAIGQFTTSAANYIINKCTIDNISVTAENGNNDSNSRMGGLIGEVIGKSNLSIAEISVLAELEGPGMVGGLIGRASPEASGTGLAIKNCTIKEGTTVYDRSVIKDTSSAGGLIGNIISSGKVEITDNEVLAGRIVSSKHSGGLIGYTTNNSAGLKIENCNIKEEIEVKAENTGASACFAGGLIGRYASTGSGNIIRNCNVVNANILINNTTYASNGRAGGFIGEVDGTVKPVISECTVNAKIAAPGHVGGFIGRFNNGSATEGTIIRDCTAVITGGVKDTTDITVSGTQAYTGGFIGYVGGSAKLTLLRDNTTPGNINSARSAGGFIGYFENNGAESSITECYVNGEISVKAENTNGASYAGGFIGYMLRTGEGMIIDSSFARDKVTVVATDSNKTAGCAAGGYIGYAGRNNGDNIRFNISNITVLADVTSSLNSGGFIGYFENNSASRASSIESCSVLQGTTVKDVNASNSGYAGGFIGRLIGNKQISISDCTTAATDISGTMDAGGFIGRFENTNADTGFTSCRVDDPTIEINVKSGESSAGGFIGRIQNSANSKFAYSDSITITNPRISVMNSVTNDLIYAGGFIGYSNVNNIELRNINIVYNKEGYIKADAGQRTNTTAAGGILGGIKDKTDTIISDCTVITADNNVEIGAYSQNCYAGGIAAFAKSNDSISNCHINGDNITIKAYYSGAISGTGNCDAGGILGYVELKNTEIYDCGIVSKNLNIMAMGPNVAAGGIIGKGYKNGTDIIERCYVVGANAEISAIGYDPYCGGIIGICRGEPTRNIYLRDSFTAVKKVEARSKGSGRYMEAYAGGLVGRLFHNSSDSRIERCYAAGSGDGNNIIASNEEATIEQSRRVFAGGLVGQIEHAITISDSYATANVFVRDICNHSNSATINAAYAGGIVGHIFVNGLNMINVYAANNVSAECVNNDKLFIGSFIGGCSNNNTDKWDDFNKDSNIYSVNLTGCFVYKNNWNDADKFTGTDRYVEKNEYGEGHLIYADSEKIKNGQTGASAYPFSVALGRDGVGDVKVDSFPYRAVIREMTAEDGTIQIAAPGSDGSYPEGAELVHHGDWPDDQASGGSDPAGSAAPARRNAPAGNVSDTVREILAEQIFDDITVNNMYLKYTDSITDAAAYEVGSVIAKADGTYAIVVRALDTVDGDIDSASEAVDISSVDPMIDSVDAAPEADGTVVCVNGEYYISSEGYWIPALVQN